MNSIRSGGRRLFPALLGLAALLSVSLASTARAQPMADRVPADAIIYVGWMGLEDKSPGFAGSHLEAVMKEANFQQLVDETFPKLLAKISEKDRQAAEVINIAKPIVVPMLKHPTAIFVGAPEFVARDQPPKVKAGLVCMAGADADAMHQQIENLMTAAPQQVRDMVKVARQGNVVSVLVNYDAVPAGGPGQGLLGSAKFKAMAPHMVANASLAIYVDVEALLAAGNKAVDLFAPPEAQKYWPRVRDAIGLQGVKHFVWTAGFDGKDWADHLFLHVPEPRQGLFALADPTPLSPEALKSIPVTATVAGGMKFDFAKLVTGLRTAIAQVEPEAGRKVDEVLAQASQGIGMDLQKDVLETLGDEWVYYVDPMTGGRGVFGGVLVNRLRNPQKAEAALTKLEALINDALAKNIHEKDITVKFLTVKSGDTTIHYLGTPLVSPAWAVKGQYLVVALFPQMVAGAADQIGAPAKSILDNPRYQAVRTRLGVANANGFSYIDLQETAPDGYALWVAISRLTGFGDMFGIPAPAMLMPPLRKLMPHMAPAGSVTWTDKDGIHAKAIAPFPGATIIGTDPLGGLIGAVPGLALPYLATQRRAEFRRAEFDRPAEAQPQPRVEPPPPLRPQPRPLPPQ
jgi:hypothetical protein